MIKQSRTENLVNRPLAVMSDGASVQESAGEGMGPKKGELGTGLGRF